MMPGTKRFFYRDPLAAAWMAEHFGMKFELKASQNQYPYCSGGFIGVMMYDENNKLLGSRPHHSDELLYIHLDSLHLLEPQDGDIGENPEGRVVIKRFKVNNPDFEVWQASGRYPSELSRIIQRNGTPFHWPELESA